MRHRFADAAAVAATGLRGLRSRLLLTVGSVLLAAIAVAAAVVGPMYQSGSSSSYLVTSLRAEPPATRGVTVDFHADSSLPIGRVVPAALAADRTLPLDGFSRAQWSLTSDRLPVGTEFSSTPTTGEIGRKRLEFAIQHAQVHLFADPAGCRHLLIAGRCPSHPGEMLILRSDSEYTKTHIGDRVQIDGLRKPLTVVGIYSIPPSKVGYWFDPTRFISVLPQPAGLGMTPYYPAPFIVTPSTLTGLSRKLWFVRMDHRLPIPANTTADTLRIDVGQLHATSQRVADDTANGRTTVERGNALRAVLAKVDARRSTAQQTVAPAVVSLILVALVLLLRLLSAAMDLRQPELALASLRGISRAQLWVLGLLEPVLILAIAVPVGIVAGYVWAVVLARVWLVPGLPVPFAIGSLFWAIGVVVAALVVAAVVVRSAANEPLSAQIAGVRRPAKRGRWGLLLQLLVVAAAVAMLATTAAAHKRAHPTAADLVLPILLAVACGLVTSVAAALVARWWSRRSSRRRGVSGYVASRTISRRREGTLVILPLTAALAIAVFAAGVFTAAAAWRGSAAATMVGSGSAYQVDLPLAQAVGITHQVDPKGRWLMAVGADDDATNGQKLVVDAPRLARVADWQDNWTPGLSASDISQLLSPSKPPIVFTGHRLQLTVDNRVQGTRQLLLSFTVAKENGLPGTVLVGPFGPGRSTRTATLPDCSHGCPVSQLIVSGAATAPAVLRGHFTVSGAKVDGSPLPRFFSTGWRAADPSTYGVSRSVTSASTIGERLDVGLDSHGQETVALLTPADVPNVIPALMGRTTHQTLTGRHGDVLLARTYLSTSVPVRSVGTTESMPFYGPAGMLVDYTMFTRLGSVDDGDTTVYILARSDTPASVLAKLADHGITQHQTLGAVRRVLDQDAYALALNLYVVVTVLVILLALAGLAANLAVQLPDRRRDAASLRVVGIRRLAILRAAILEFVVVLGAAAVAGIAAGAVSQLVVVRTVTLGYADSATVPRVLPTLGLTRLVVLLAVVAAVLLVFAVVVGTMTVRGARTATLRERTG